MYTKTQEKAERVLALYNDGKTVTQIIEAEGPMSKKTVKKILASHDIDYTLELDKKNKAKPDRAIEMYKQGKSLLEIQAELKLTYTTVRDILENAGIEQRSLSEVAVLKHGNTIDDKAFDELNEESLYWIGLLYADGHIYKQREYGVQLSLHSDDTEHLYKYVKFLKSNREPKLIKGSNCVRFRFGSQRLHSRLVELGFTHDKSYTGKPHEELKHSRHFWRGVVDGDGCLWATRVGYRRSLGICGTEATCVGFRDFVLENSISTKVSVLDIKGEQTWKVTYEGFIADQIAELLYGDSKIYMERKYRKYIDYFGGTP